ncbi:MAG TPA: CsbD family protein, partial [Pyrinomonadaceae bacterium]
MNNQGSGTGSGGGTLGEEASALGDRVSGNVKDAYGAVTGNESVEREGEAQADYGAARQSNNRVLTGMFRDRESAERAYNSVTSRGYTND